MSGHTEEWAIRRLRNLAIDRAIDIDAAAMGENRTASPFVCRASLAGPAGASWRLPHQALSPDANISGQEQVVRRCTCAGRCKGRSD